MGTQDLVILSKAFMQFVLYLYLISPWFYLYINVWIELFILMFDVNVVIIFALDPVGLENSALVWPL